MVRVGLARTSPDYSGLSAPFGPGRSYPESPAWLDAEEGPVNHVYSATRLALAAAGLDAERFGTEAWNPLRALVEPGARIQ